MKRLQRLLLVHEGESGNVLYFLFFFMIISAGMAIGRSTADALFFKRFGIEYLPLMYMIQSFLLAGVSTLYAAFADRVPAEAFFRVLFGILVLLVATSWLVISYTGSSLIYPVYYLIYEVSSELLLVHAALYMNQNLNTLQSKRLSPLIYAGAQIGTLIGGLVLALFAPVIGTQNLILLWCLLLGAGIAAITIRHIRYGTSAHFRAPKKTRNLVGDCMLDIKQGVRYTLRSDLLRATSLALFFMVIAFYILCYSVNLVYTRTFESEEALTSFFGGLTAATSALALLAQLFVVNRAIRRFGVRGVNLLFPLTTLASLLTLAFSFALPAALLGSINKDALMPAFRNPVRNMFFNVLPGYLQGRARAMSIAVVLPLALLVCGILLWFMQRMDNPGFFLLPGAIAAAFYFYFCKKMNRAYISTLLSTLRERLFLPSERMYSELQGGSDDVLQEVLRGVNHEDNEVATAFSRVLVDSFPDKAVDSILERIEKADSATSDRLLRLLAPLDLSRHTQQLYRLESQGDTRLQSTVLLMLVENGDERSLAAALNKLDSDNPRLRAVGICAALRYPGRHDIEANWLDLLDSEVNSGLAALALIPEISRISGHSRARIIAGYQQAVNRLMREQSEEIKIRVLKGLGQWPASIGIKLPVDPAEFLSSDNPGLREMAAGCLYLIAAPQRDALVLQALGDGHPRVRDAAARSLGKASPDSGDIALCWINDNRGTPRAQQSLLGILQQQDLPAAVYECIASQKVDETLQLQDACALLEDRSGRDNEPAALTLVRYTLNERMEQTIQLALLALEPLHEPGIIGIIRAGFSSGDIRHAANACEVLCNLDNRHVAGRLHDILQQTLSKQRAENTGMRFKDQAQVLDWCIKEKDEWLQYCARHALQSLAAGDARA